MALLICGIDPGTTAAIAALDSETGKILYKESAKEFPISIIISSLIRFGKPIVIGCDKCPPPDFAKKLATKLGIRLVYPAHDLKIIEKKILAHGIKAKDSHEFDAIASALFAFNQTRELSGKVDRWTVKNNRQEIRMQMKELVLSKEGMSIQQALELLEPPKKEIIEKNEFYRNENNEEKENNENNNIGNKKNEPSKETKLKKTIKLMSENIAKQYNEIANLEKKVSNYQNIAHKPEKNNHLLNNHLLIFKEKLINNLLKQIETLDQNIIALKEENLKNIKIILNKKESVLCKKIDNLSWTTFLKAQDELNIKSGDTLFVKNPDISSKKTIDELYSLNTTIVCDREVPKNIKDLFVVVNKEHSVILESSSFMLIKKEKIEEEKKKKNIIEKVINDYKEERIFKQ